MTSAAMSISCNVALRIGLSFLTGVLLITVGCVSRQTYDRTRAEAQELTRTLENTQAEVRELDQHIIGLHAANRQEDAVATELRAAIQREEDLLPLMRQRADDKLASLQAQVATLVNQSRVLTRQFAEAKRARASLQAMATQYEQEVEEARSIRTLLSLETEESAPPPVPPTTTPVVPSVALEEFPGPPPATAQADSPMPIQKTPADPPAKMEPLQPAPVEESWIDMIANWFASWWSWILG